ncbi:MAG: hypothetical protein LKF49_06350 [Bifidobacterium tibiigranuli]|jgi:hypothetical protein|uniref:hypothetical protein n=1 Tax=Bifidobacterium tibiigranuli TaxID=2172043 RepID=UPI002352CB4D|nr:hypothetical protein [Bifidobacterium tibiigranuli]MCH3973816.1 hypothetical protein [Bifidobacterium tibiigranuli]MCH4189404.1 hypothetical protein [Bifidobacterium tibiigranuli]MCH4203811.1 hypothetical protein [Bifidobacterium tibiigranuli]MCH4274347.1 hypothetical protein [Bifidobacterium tibiigranuli]MCI1791430.1 hypothetical protein [Bifidobacterium tibiigranuli]
MAKRLSDIAELTSGSPQFRITESAASDAPAYSFYEQSDIADDLTGIDSRHDAGSSARNARKQVHTNDSVKTLSEGDIIFSLISGEAAIIRRNHAGLLYTQNYVKITLHASKREEAIAARYLVYLINNDANLNRQLHRGLQGSQVLKYTVKQLSELKLQQQPPFETQQLLGNVYFDQLRLAALRHRVADNSSILILNMMKEALQ